MGYLRDFGFEMQEFTAFEISDFKICLGVTPLFPGKNP
jgi:hypothetical protein